MNFELSEEQDLLKNTLTRLLADRYRFEQRAAYSREKKGFSKEIWASFAELGLLGISFSEQHGGFGGGAVEAMIVAERLGTHLVVEPWIETVITAGGFLRRGASEEQRLARIPKIISGGYLMSFAQAERHSRYDLHDVTTTAQSLGEGWCLNGEKVMVINAESAQEYIVSARVSGNRRDRDGLALFLVSADAPGVTVAPFGRTDGRCAANVRFENVALLATDVLGEPGQAIRLIETVVDETIAAQSAEALGSMQAALDMTVKYLKTRSQFGRPIGEFQVLQHRASEMVVAVEQTRSMVFHAAIMAEAENESARRRAISATKVEVCRNSLFVAEQAIQMHGGIGMTMEYAVGHHLKHLKALEATYGDGNHHLRALITLNGPLADGGALA
ncbi:acyl-CoA dehydrogenase family protein [Mesorhizobium abyssinicae]|uniref:acyl-CoA dehydrogenase family protein n=1 Tax=Mesorhizobium abyssinicae TaxID=1209958 RepID=UPI003394D26E